MNYDEFREIRIREGTHLMIVGPPFGGLFRLGALAVGAPSGTHSFVHQYPAL